MHNYEDYVDSSAVVTATGPGATGANNRATGAFIVVDVTAVGGSTPTMVAKLQWSADGSNWIDMDTTNGVTASITAIGRYAIRVYPGMVAAAPAAGVSTVNAPLPRLWRLYYTLGGSTPSFTFSSSAAYITTED